MAPVLAVSGGQQPPSKPPEIQHFDRPMAVRTTQSTYYTFLALFCTFYLSLRKLSQMVADLVVTRLNRDDRLGLAGLLLFAQAMCVPC